ncbi:rhomboid family intramembrane serine protease [Rossellomorea vietnamensis]|uniref:Rhomboid family intramembrane serine protease n=2 Tax=Rossellomorea TaxID=2837508 RepID=A0A5D4K7H3_9BACI|nr:MULTISPECIES: rhomboid family intramembrane serine protease [Rossellomorea]TYR73367.1 rhomboid family intramembrane serine protease [Rossellomorea vietnamensis]TYS73355.1 rhomboid family intramembrane serine protease [Rossellomorea aquimaris]
MFIRTESFSQFIRLYPIVSLIILIHLLLFSVTLIPFLPQIWVYEHLAGINLLIFNGEWWRLITPIFVHLGFAHLLFNSFSLILFAPPLERMLGKVKFTLVYLSCGIIANAATYLLKPLTYNHVGASGAIFGLFGIYVGMALFHKHLISQQNKQVIIPIVVIGLVMTFFQSNINITAHLFGLLAGITISWLLLPFMVKNRY